MTFEDLSMIEKATPISQFVPMLVVIRSSTNQVMHEACCVCLMIMFISIHATTAMFPIDQMIRVLSVHSMVCVTVSHLLSEVPTELVLYKAGH